MWHIVLLCIVTASAVNPQIQKCCGLSEMYDTVNHLCRTVVENNGTYDEALSWFSEHLPGVAHDPVFKFNNGFGCTSAEYDVRLINETVSFSLTLVGSTLHILTQRGNTVVSPFGKWCVDRDYTSKQLIGRVCTEDCASLGAYCITKCCPIGTHYKQTSNTKLVGDCVSTIDQDAFFNFSLYINPIKENYGIGDVLGIRVEELKCPDGRVILYKSDAEDEHSLTKDGKLLREHKNAEATYCLELFDLSIFGTKWFENTGTTCRRLPVASKNFELAIVLKCISCVCLLLTLVVYCSIPTLHTIHGLSLICYMSVMLLTNGCLLLAQLDLHIEQNTCVTIGYGIYFGAVASFAWLNVMCFEIWRTFASNYVAQKKKSTLRSRQFRWYSLYAWGLSLTLTLGVFLLDKFPVNKVLDANMGEGACWFGAVKNSKQDWPHYIFFVIPMGVVVTINFVLWLLTARHCVRVRSEMQRLQAGSVRNRANASSSGFKAKYNNFMLTGKLWVVMGAGWVTELLSTVLDPGEMNWVITTIDAINELQGAFIFIILILKPKMYKLIKKRLGFQKPEKQSNEESAESRTTYSESGQEHIAMDKVPTVSVQKDIKQN